MSYLDQESRYGGSFVAVLAGYGLSRFLGANLWLPALVAVLVNFGLSKLRPMASAYARWALALVIAQSTWMLIGALIIPAQFGEAIIDIVVGFGLAVWAVLALSRWAFGFIIGFEALGLAVNLYLAATLGQWTSVMVALVTHILIRVGIIALSVIALKEGPGWIGRPAEEADEVFS